MSHPLTEARIAFPQRAGGVERLFEHLRAADWHTNCSRTDSEASSRIVARILVHDGRAIFLTRVDDRQPAELVVAELARRSRLHVPFVAFGAW